MRIANPVLAREIKERLRSPRGFVMLSVYLTVLAGVLYLTYRFALAFLQRAGFFGGGGFTSAALGRTMFEWTLFVLLLLLGFIAPGIASGSIAGERERRTLHLLQVTMLTPRSIAIGKWAASVSFLLLMILASAPLFTVPLVLGGVTPMQVIRGLVVVASLTVFLVALGTFISSVAKRSQTATISVYLLTVLIVIASFAILIGEMAVRTIGGQGADPGKPISAYMNTITALADAVVDPGTSMSSPGPFTAMRSGIDEITMEVMQAQARFDPESGQLIQAGVRIPRALHIWPVHVALLLAGTALLLGLTSLRLRLPAMKLPLSKSSA